MKSIIFFLFFSFVCFAQTKVEDIQTFTLENGMKVIVLEDHSIPNANLYFFWKVGSRNEYPGITGISHFFEHMMFNGAKKFGPKMFDRTMEANGGANNAYTSENVTVYTDWFPSSSLEVMFDLEADRIANLNFDDKMIESERGVILSERSTGLENSPLWQLWEQVQGTAFFAHPYQIPVIGYESDIKSWTKEDLQTYFKTYYSPSNCVVVIVGDVTVDEIKFLSQKYFEPIERGPLPREMRTIEPEQLGEKKITVTRDVPSPYIMISYHVPQTNSEEYYALSLLESILSSGKTSRLYSSLIDEKQIAIDLGTDYSYAFDPFLFTFYAICSKDVKPDSVETALVDEIDKIIKAGVTPDEIQKVKNQKLMDFYYTMETINGKANTIGTYDLFFGDYKKLFSAPQDFAKVTAEEIQKVAGKYFTAKNRTIGIMQAGEESQ
ncbi:MAG: insulinase family protein [Ignavibacteria bacterium]|nr:insulinase family protein [Ignavibacteria bacterium]